MDSSTAAAVAANAILGITPSTARSRKSSITFSTVLSTVLDVVVFLSVSIGYILQDWYYRIWGYPKKSLKGELVLITGAGGGLGRLLAIRMTRLGAKTVLWDISNEGLKETTNILSAMGGEYKELIVDISKKEEVYKAADHIRETMGDVTLLINNAGVVSGRALLDTPDEMIERSFSVNTISHFWTTKAFLPMMLQKNHGHIVTIASLAGHAGISKLVDYCASKFAAVGFDEALRLELEHIGADGVFTTCICPYFIQATGMFEDVSSKWVQTLNPDEVADRIVEAIRRNEKIAIVPSYLKFMLIMKWVFPWGCISGFLQRIVMDAAPRNEFIQFIPPALRNLNGGGKKKKNKMSLNNNNDTDIPNFNKAKDQQSPILMRSITTVTEERNL